MIHTGICDECNASFAAWAHWERDEDIPEPENWEEYPDCPVCWKGTVNWDWSDPMTSTIRTGY